MLCIIYCIIHCILFIHSFILYHRTQLTNKITRKIHVLKVFHRTKKASGTNNCPYRYTHTHTHKTQSVSVIYYHDASKRIQNQSSPPAELSSGHSAGCEVPTGAEQQTTVTLSWRHRTTATDSRRMSRQRTSCRVLCMTDTTARPPARELPACRTSLAHRSDYRQIRRPFPCHLFSSVKSRFST